MKDINQQPINNDVRYFRCTKSGECYYGLTYQWDAKVDLTKKMYVSRNERSEYATCNLPTINELVANGTLEEVSEIEELDITGKDVDLQDFDAVVAYAKERGFNIEHEALEHNYNCWLMDFKSGFRGKECHVFTPCGCNPLQYSISKLDDRVDWQTSYYA